MQRTSLILPAIAFLVAGGCGRMILRHTESRWQIVFWIVLAIVGEVWIGRGHLLLRFGRPVILGVGAAIGVILAKAYLEPRAIRADTHVVRARAKAVVREVKTKE